MAPRLMEYPFDWESVPSRHDTRPTQRIATLVDINGSACIDFIQWGWWYYAKGKKSDSKVKYMFPNSRNDTILENLGNPSKKYNQALSANRVLIPVKAFYEWPEIDGVKVKHRISTTDEIFMLGGAVTQCEDLKRNKITAVNIITRDPGPQILPLHDREPLIISKERQEEWLLGQKFASESFLNSFFKAQSPKFKIERLG